jgi:hypothetical protein
VVQPEPSKSTPKSLSGRPKAALSSVQFPRICVRQAATGSLAGESLCAVVVRGARPPRPLKFRTGLKPRRPKHVTYSVLLSYCFFTNFSSLFWLLFTRAPTLFAPGTPTTCHAERQAGCGGPLQEAPRLAGIPPVTPRARSIQPSACTAVHVVNESQSALTVTWAKNNRCHS